MGYATEIVNPNKLKSDDLVIVFIGQTGSGKSHIIDTLLDQTGKRAGGGLASFTKKVSAIRLKSHEVYGDRLIFVDTPGFDDTLKSDKEGPGVIIDWIRNLNPNLTLAGTIYSHKINLNRMGATSNRSLRRMSDLCTDKKKVALVTTMWNQIHQREDGIKREECLNNTYWKPLLDAGASLHRFENTPQSAWSIINALLVQDSKVNDLRQAWEDVGKELNNTIADGELSRSLDALLSKDISQF